MRKPFGIAFTVFVIMAIVTVMVFSLKQLGWVTILQGKSGIGDGKEMQKDELKKSGLEYTEDGIYFNGEPIYFWSGEFPYYRIHPNDWEDRLEKIKRAGVHFITAYIPWNQHEYQENVFDFTGESGNERRNLIGFIELIQEKGMYYIPKPGPFICAEVQHGGIPDWLTDKHPDIIMKDQYGKNVGFRQDGKPLPDYLNKTYLAYVEKWYTAVVEKVLSKYQYPQGPVIAMQVSNEIIYSTSDLADPFSWGYSDSVKEMYQSWLEDEYGSIGEYNALHDTSFSVYTDIIQPKQKDWWFKSQKSWLQYQDWVLFKEFYGTKILEIYGEILKRAGIVVPFYHDAGMLADEAPMNFGKMSDVMWMGVNFWLFPHPMNSYDSYVEGIQRLKQLRGSQTSRPAIAPELNWGWGNEKEFDFLTRYTLPFLRGINIYSIVDGDYAGNLNGKPYTNNPEPFPGCAPIDAKGKLRPAYYELTRLTNYTKHEIESFIDTKPLSDICLGFYIPYNSLFVYKKWAKIDEDQLSKVFNSAIGTNEFLQGFIQGFIKEDMEYDCINIQGASVDELLQKKFLLVLCQDMMDEKTQQKLVDYANAGGTLVFMPSIPYMDLKLQPSSILKDELFNDIEIKESKKHKRPINVIWNGYDEELKGGLVTNSLTNYSDAYSVLANTDKGDTVAVEKEFGKGKVLYSGTYIPNAGFIKWLAEQEGNISRYAYSNHEEVEVVPIANASTEDIYLFITNRNLKEQKVEINYINPFIKNERINLKTNVGAQSSSIIRLNNGMIESASLNGNRGVFAENENGSIHADSASEMDYLWEAGNKVVFSANSTTNVKIVFHKKQTKKVIQVIDQNGVKVDSEFSDGTLNFRYIPSTNVDEYYQILVK